MHYYKRNLGDYAKKAGRLTMLEHGAYNQLLDAIYDREEFPTLEEALDWTWARDEAEITAVKFVLSKFFEAQEDGRFVQNRIKEELDAYKSKAEN
ncbi:YdaU family protein, partial [Acinetobacter baumannii]|nr:YdaU family protein [Acinetobacter baumannii]